MTDVLAVHGAFRGPWYWEPLAAALGTHGHTLHGVDLTGDTLADWTAALERTVRSAPRGASPTSDRSQGRESGVVVLLGHSMGGVVVQAAPAQLADVVTGMILIDSPLIGSGQRAVDVSGPTAPDDSLLPPRDTQIPPSPVGADQGFDDPDLARWVNAHLTPVAMGPQLDPVPDDVLEVERTILFCDRTPDGYPSTFARRRCQDEGIEHTVIDAHHDLPVLDPEAMAERLAAVL